MDEKLEKQLILKIKDIREQIDSLRCELFDLRNQVVRIKNNPIEADDSFIDSERIAEKIRKLDAEILDLDSIKTTSKIKLGFDISLILLSFVSLATSPIIGGILLVFWGYNTYKNARTIINSKNDIKIKQAELNILDKKYDDISARVVDKSLEKSIKLFAIKRKFNAKLEAYKKLIEKEKSILQAFKTPNKPKEIERYDDIIMSL